MQAFSKHDSVKVIDVHSDVHQIAKECMQCDVIVSSSLHGLILADALGIPSRWLGVSETVMKGGFKFQDYFMSVQRNEPTPLFIDELSVGRVLKEAHLRITPFNRQELLDACPFRHESVNTPSDIKFACI